MASPLPGREPLIPSAIDGWPDGPASYELQTGELIGIVVMYAVLFIDLVIMIYAVIRARTYKPLRAKQPMTLFYLFIAGLFWVTGSNVGFRVFPYPANLTPAFCQIFVGWMEIVFGAYAFLHFFFLRLWKLYVIFQGARANSKLIWRAEWLPNLIFFTPALLIGILTSSLRLVDLLVVPTGEVVCYAYDAFVYGSYAVLFIYFIVLAVLAFRLRHVPLAYFNEYKRLMVALGSIFFFWVASLALMLTESHNELWGRVLLCCLQVVVLNTVIGITIGDVIYYSIVSPAAFEERFQLQTTGSNGHRGGASSSNSQRNSSSAANVLSSKDGKKDAKTEAENDVSTFDATSVIEDPEAMKTTTPVKEKQDEETN